MLVFLYAIYHSTAEGLAEGHIYMDTAIAATKNSHADTDTLRRAAHSVTLDLTTYSNNVESWFQGPGFEKGQRRYLPHGNAMSLYWEYAASMRSRSGETASFWTFWRVLKKVFLRSYTFGSKANMPNATSALG